MEKFLITGFSGFVSSHFLKYLEDNTIRSSILGIDLNPPEFQFDQYHNLKCSFKKVNMLEKNAIKELFCNFAPDYILHFASFSSVGFSWKNPTLSFTNNTNLFLNLLEEVRAAGVNCRIISIGSSEEYGNVDPKNLPLKENQVLNPLSPYAVARVAQEHLSKLYSSGYGLDIIMTRSFNHLGPGQKPNFVISSFAKQMVEMKNKGLTKGHLKTGDINIIRDFLDVRDVVRAYYFLLKYGKRGEIYNICSGKGTSIKEIIDMMANILGLDIKIRINEDLIRPNDNKIIIGDNNKIRREIGWQRKIPLGQSLRDVLEYWKNELK
jgi:GDP-4-dehydro-6-deoxy-D-mannose reductase